MKLHYSQLFPLRRRRRLSYLVFVYNLLNALDLYLKLKTPTKFHWNASVDWCDYYKYYFLSLLLHSSILILKDDNQYSTIYFDWTKRHLFTDYQSILLTKLTNHVTFPNASNHPWNVITTINYTFPPSWCQKSSYLTLVYPLNSHIITTYMLNTALIIRPE